MANSGSTYSYCKGSSSKSSSSKSSSGSKHSSGSKSSSSKKGSSSTSGRDSKSKTSSSSSDPYAKSLSNRAGLERYVHEPAYESAWSPWGAASSKK